MVETEVRKIHNYGDRKKQGRGGGKLKRVDEMKFNPLHLKKVKSPECNCIIYNHIIEYNYILYIYIFNNKMQ